MLASDILVYYGSVALVTFLCCLHRQWSRRSWLGFDYRDVFACVGGGLLWPLLVSIELHAIWRSR